MLERDPEQRIGSGPDDSLEISKHAFFADMDWKALIDLKLEAPYIPEIRTDLNDNPSITEQDAIV